MLNNFIKYFFSEERIQLKKIKIFNYSLSKKKQKKITYEYFKTRLENSVKNTVDKIDFTFGKSKFLNISYINKITPIPIINNIIFLTKGNNNSIFLDETTNKIYRVTTDPIDIEKENIDEYISESQLALRLSDLKIYPKMYDCYFVKNKDLAKKNTHLIIEYAFAQNNNLQIFLKSNQFLIENTSDIVNKIIKLYEKLVYNNILCLDIHPNNIVVDKNLNLYLIDIGDGFCISQEFKLYNNHLLKFKKFLNKQKIQISKENIQSSFIKLNILQLGAILVIENNNNTKIKKLVKMLIQKTIDITDLYLMNILSKFKLYDYMSISDFLQHYIIPKKNVKSNSHFLFKDFKIENNSEYTILLAYYVCLFEIKDSINYFLETDKTVIFNI